MTDIIPDPAYRIVNQRMVLRCWNPADVPLLKEAIDSSLEHLRPWMPWAHDEPQELQKNIDRMRTFRGRFDLGESFVYGIFSRDETLVLGGSGLHTRIGEGALEIGYWIRLSHINHGLATEASAALTRVAFEVHKVNRVEIHCDVPNLRSAAVPRKLGFSHEAILRQRLPRSGEGLRDVMIWTIFLADYPTSPSASADIEAFDALGRRIIPVISDQ